MSVTGSEAAAAGDSEPRRAEEQLRLPTKRRRLPLRSSSKKRPRDVDDSIEGHQPASSLPSRDLSEHQSQRIKAYIATSEASASSSTSTNTDASSSLHVSSHTDRFGTFFTSGWNTSFLLTVAPHGPWRGSEVYAEIPGQGGQPIDASVTSIPIDPPSGHELVRIDGSVPLWFHSKPSKIDIEIKEDHALFTPASTPTGAADMPPPPEETYASGELAVASAQQFALEHGYKLIIQSSVVFGPQKHRRWYLRCHESAERAAKARGSRNVGDGHHEGGEGEEDEAEGGNGDVGKREGQEDDSPALPTHTRCRFAITVRPLNGRWKLDVTHAVHHGHDKDTDLLAAEARKLTPDERLLAERLYAQDSKVGPAKILEMINNKRRNLNKLPLVSRAPIIQHAHHMRTKRKAIGVRGGATTASGFFDDQDDSSKRPRSSSTSPSSPTTSMTSLEDRCASDFRSSLTQHLGRSLLRLPKDHGTRISAAAQLYLSSMSPADRNGSVKSTSTGSLADDAAPHSGTPRRMRCKLCQQQGHNRRTCPQRRSSQLEDVDEEEQTGHAP